MNVCPLDYRYGRDAMKAIFSYEGRLQRMLEVEAALAGAHAELGHIPESAAEEISKKASLKYVKPERVEEIEAEIRHDVMALVRALSEVCEGDAGKYVHLGATSNDIIDTATALQLRDAIDIIEDNLKILGNTMAALAERHRDTVMLGRTHGQMATPITFGLKIAVYLDEVRRHLERLIEARKRVAVGKMMGAVGTGAGFGEDALKIKDIVGRKLGIDMAIASGQIVGRDRYIEFIAIASNIAVSLEKFATEIRNLQRSEIDEVAEAFDTEKQVGSSTMAHKRNPITSENICGLARVLRGFLTPQMESGILWHERDLTNSSAERFTLPHTAVLLDDILRKMEDVFRNIVVKKENMLRNLESSRGLIMAESVMLALSEKGMGRQEAHELIRKLSMKAEKDGIHLKEVLLKSEGVGALLSPEEIEEAMDYGRYTGKSGEIMDEVVRMWHRET